MFKSQYPNKIDTSVELPIARNNATEIKAEILNSLRDAIIKIEKSIGTFDNTEKTLYEKVDSVIDNSGNIKKDALDKSGVIFGDIENKHISEYAGISENKIKLDFPTKLLNTSVQLVKTEIENYLNKLKEIELKISSHVNEFAEDRHNGNNISIENITSNGSNIAAETFSNGTLQDILQEIYSAHINFSGFATALNKAHTASQIYFNPINSPDFADFENVQSVIDAIIASNIKSITTNLFSTTTSGIVRKLRLYDINAKVNGKKITEEASVSYTPSIDANQLITFSESIPLTEEIEKFDMIYLSNTNSDIDSDGLYTIYDYTLDGENLQSVKIIGGTKAESLSETTGFIVKNPYKVGNSAYFLPIVRPRFNKTNTPDILFVNPDCSYVISNNLDARMLSDSAKNLTFEIDGDEHIIEVYDSSLEYNNLDSVIYLLNNYFSENLVSALAGKIKTANCYELIITHMIPTNADIETERYIKILESDSSDASQILGFSNIIDVKVYGYGVNNIMLNGTSFDATNLTILYTSEDAEVQEDSNSISFLTKNPINLGIKIGHYVFVENYGLFRIENVTSNSIIVDDYDVLFSAPNNERIFILKNSISLEEIEFSELVGSSGQLMIDLYLTSDYRFGYNIRAAINDSVSSGSHETIIIDISDDYLIDSSANLNITTGNIAKLEEDSEFGDQVQIYNYDIYTVRSVSGQYFVKILTNGESPTSDISVEIQGFSQIPNGVFLLGRCNYTPSMGIIFGSSGSGIPSLLDKRKTGTLSEENISSSFIEKYIEKPRSEMFSDGVASGLNISTLFIDSSNIEITISPGYYYCAGIRYQFNGINSIPFEHNGDNFFIGFDAYGCLRIELEIYDASYGKNISPFINKQFVYLSYIEVGSSSNTEYDIRKFISYMNNKTTTEIIVCKNSEYGQFQTIKGAVNFARVFSKFINIDYPTKIFIKPGVYIESGPIILDFDILIEGSGASTIILKDSAQYSNYSQSTAFSATHYANSLFLIGKQNLTDGQASDINYGVTLKNFTYKTSDTILSLTSSNLNFVIMILQRASNVSNSPVRIDSVNFIGPSTFTGSTTEVSGTLNGVRQEIPVVFAKASNMSNTTYIRYGNLFLTNCFFNYMGTERALIGAIITKSGSYIIRDIIVNNNIVKNASPNLNYVSSGTYNVIASSDNYSLGDTLGVTYENIVIGNNAIRD